MLVSHLKLNEELVGLGFTLPVKPSRDAMVHLWDEKDIRNLLKWLRWHFTGVPYMAETFDCDNDAKRTSAYLDLEFAKLARKRRYPPGGNSNYYCEVGLSIGKEDTYWHTLGLTGKGQLPLKYQTHSTILIRTPVTWYILEGRVGKMAEFSLFRTPDEFDQKILSSLLFVLT